MNKYDVMGYLLICAGVLISISNVGLLIHIVGLIMGFTSGVYFCYRIKTR